MSRAGFEPATPVFELSRDLDLAAIGTGMNILIFIKIALPIKINSGRK
jgi:hypothetical protein